MNQFVSRYPDCLVAEPGGPVGGHLRVPGDKSISHRSVIFAGLAEGTSQIRGFLRSADCLATLQAMRQLGVAAHWRDDTALCVTGVGQTGLQAPDAPIDCGNSGTGMRLLAGILAAQPFASTLVGDASLSRRPMRRIIEPLRDAGARIRGSAAGTAPLYCGPTKFLRGRAHVSRVASAQVKSCLLLAGLFATDGQPTCVTEPAKSRDHTERLLPAFGYPVTVNGQTACVQPGQRLQAADIQVPADISSAAFFLVAAACTPGSDLLLTDVCINPTRAGVITILQAMGADIQVHNRREQGGEWMGDIRVRGGTLRGVTIDPALVPSAIDEFPAIFIAAAVATGSTRLSQAEELRAKESDRIAVMAKGLRRLGIACEESPDGLVIHGGRIKGGHVDAAGDHRCAMSFLMAGHLAGGAVMVSGCGNIVTSYPEFITHARAVGVRIHRGEK